MRNCSGIYIIKTLIDTRCYIGSSVKIKDRIVTHIGDLKRKKHCNSHLQNFVNKYGIDKIIFEILEQCPIEKLTETEQKYIETLKPKFNIAKIAGQPIVITQPMKEYKSNLTKQQWKNRTPQQKKDIMEKIKHTNSKKTPEQKAHLRTNCTSYGMLGKNHTNQTKTKIRNKLIGRKIGGAIKTDQVSQKIKALHADPNSKYNSQEYKDLKRKQLNTPEANKKKGKAWVVRKNKKIFVIIQALIKSKQHHLCV